MKTPTYLNIEDEFESIDDLLVKAPYITKRSKKNIAYINLPAAFDIEVSSFYEGEEKRSCMYIWVLGINGKVILGRTWNQFLQNIKAISYFYNTDIKHRFIIYVHNLAYEFQFIRHLFKWEEVFSVDTRRPIYACTNEGIEFRCSYILSQYSLETVGNNLNKYKVKKLKGDLDYDLIRHSKTPINNKEKQYVINDGLIVMSYIQELIEYEGDITKIPITGTGFTRNLCKTNCLRGDNKYNYRNVISRLTLEPDEYQQLKRAYQGGFTHANSLYVQSVINNVDSFDFTSSYPSVLITEKFPMSKGVIVKIKSYDDLRSKLKKYCCLFDIKFENIEAKVDYEHYIARSKCWNIEDYTLDNGRVVKASKLGITITEQDFFIIEKMYKWDHIKIYNFTIYMKDYLPKDFVKTVIKLYIDKTQLKGVKEKEIEYARSKSLLNSCYGMCVTDPAKDESIYEDVWISQHRDIDEAIRQYNHSRNRFLFYPWGVWITAYARRNLFSGINEFKDDYIYADTDSIKVVNKDKHIEYINKYNKTIELKIQKALEYHKIPIKYGRPKTIKGVEKIIGIWDYEGQYDKFKTLGAKRYITVKNQDINITISGVNKKNGNKYLKYKFKTIDNILKNFDDQLIFPGQYYDSDKQSATGKSVHTYIDIETKGEVVDYLGNIGKYHELSSIHMESTDYSMSLSKQFVDYLFSLRSSEIL